MEIITKQLINLQKVNRVKLTQSTSIYCKRPIKNLIHLLLMVLVVLSNVQPTQFFERDGRCVQSLTDHSP